MRENIGVFRGKRKDNGEWVEGTYFCRKTAKPHMPPDATKKQYHHVVDRFDFEVTTQHIIIPNDLSECSAVLFWSDYEVDPETIGESSGVPDRNGRMMFEGDTVKMIYKAKFEHLATVEFKDGSFGLSWVYGCKRFAAFTSICNVEFEVIEK